jgi:hypothetical protein
MFAIVYVSINIIILDLESMIKDGWFWFTAET